MRVILLTVLFVLAAAPAFADETVLGPTAFDVDGGSVTTPALEKGAEYRLESGGTFQEVSANATYDHDAAYCYSDNAPTPICRNDPSISKTGLWAGYAGSDARPFYELESTTPPAYASSHRYTTRFTAAQSAPLRLLANTPEVGREYPGQLLVALYKVTAPAPCSRGTRACGSPFTPLDEAPKPGQKVIYPRPAAEATELARGPDLSKAVKSLTVDVESPERNLDVYSVVPDDDSARSAFYLCFYFAFNAEIKTLVRAEETIGSCAGAVGAVLTRCKELKRERGGPGLCGGPARRRARAAASGCPTGAIRPTKSSRKSRLKATCTPTANGVRLSLRPRRKRDRLRKLLGKHPDLVLGASYASTAESTVAVTWRLRR